MSRSATESARACAAALLLVNLWLTQNEIDAQVEISEDGLARRVHLGPLVRKALVLYEEEHGDGAVIDNVRTIRRN